MAAGNSVSQRLGVLRRRKGTIILTVVLAAALAGAFSLLQTPVYASSARLLLEPRTTESLFEPNTPLRLDPARLVRNEIEVLRSEPVLDAVRAAIGSAPAVSVASRGDTDVITITAEDVDPKRAAVVANAYASAYTDFRRRQALDDLQSAGQEVQAKVDDLKRQIDELDHRVEQAPAGEREALRSDLSQQRQSLVSTRALFEQRLDQIQVETPLKSGGATLVARASPASDPVRPRPVRNETMAVVFGLMGGIALAFLRDHLDDSLKSKEDLERAAPGVPVLGIVPLATGQRRREPSVVSIDDPSSPASESYRTLRTSIQFLSLDRAVRSLLVTSPSAGEGKTTTVANLAVAFARAGVPVVVVSCDLRRPKVHAAFDLSNEVGFTSILLGEATLDEAMQRVAGVEQLRVLASGPIPPNPSELLAPRHTTELLLSAGGGHRLVLVDAPPVLPVTDALLLSGKVDAVLLVGVAGVTARRDVARAVELLQQVHAPLVGTVFNGASDEAGYGYGFYRYTTSSPMKRRKEAASP